MTLERRQAPRHRIAATASAAGSPVRLIDLSANGVRFECFQTYALDEYVPMILPLADAHHSHVRVRCDARVVRVERNGPMFIVAATYEFVPPHLAGSPSSGHGI